MDTSLGNNPQSLVLEALSYCALDMQLFPYHLADYTCRVLRVTPFRYYIDLLFLVMRDEKSYDQIPNFTVRHALLSHQHGISHVSTY